MAKFKVKLEEVIKQIDKCPGGEERLESLMRGHLPDTLELEGELIEEKEIGQGHCASCCGKTECVGHDCNPQPTESQILNRNEVTKAQDEGETKGTDEGSIEELKFDTKHPSTFSMYEKIWANQVELGEKINEVIRKINKLGREGK